MLLQITELGAQEETYRFYHVLTPRGMSGVVRLSGAKRTITVLLQETYYRREYPASGELDAGTAPRIRDLEGGYQTIAAFVALWEHSTAEQREALIPGSGVKLPTYTRNKSGTEVRTKTKLPTTEDRPRVVHAKRTGDGWIKAPLADIRQALKGATGAVRIGHVTIAATRAKELFNTKGIFTDPILYIRPDDNDTLGALEIKSDRARMTVRHGAWDRYGGRAGFTRRVVFATS